MIRLLLTMMTVCLVAPSTFAQGAGDVSGWFDKQLPGLLETYRWLHTHPEVSYDEAGNGSVCGANLAR